MRFLRHNYVTVAIVVVILGLMGWVIYEGTMYESQLMADCLSAHKRWVVVESNTIHTIQKIGDMYYPREFTTETYGCVD